MPSAGSVLNGRSAAPGPPHGHPHGVPSPNSARAGRAATNVDWSRFQLLQPGLSGQQPETRLGSPRAALPWRPSWGLTWSRNGWGSACVTITALRKDRTEENRPCSPGRSRVRRRQLSHRNRPTSMLPFVPSCPHRLSWVKGRRESLCPHLWGSEIPPLHHPRGLQVHLTPLSPQHHPPGERSGPHTPQTHLRSSQWPKLEQCGQQKKKVILDENPGYTKPPSVSPD